MASWAAFAGMWLHNPWLLWGVGPVLASNVGFLLTAILFELLLASSWFNSSHIVYASGGNAPRKQLAAATQQRIPLRKQVKSCMTLLLGPPCFVNGTVLALAMRWLQPQVSSWLPASVSVGVLQFVALMIIADLGLYWGHRVQHESKFLWKMHSQHHAIDTPTPFSTLFINRTDAALQGSIPLFLAAVTVQPAPLVLYLFIAARIGENALNHSGLDSRLIDLLTLKLLPFRAPAAFHDAHHKYSNHAHNAKNYGESFVIWDVLFNTYNPLSGCAMGKVQADKAQ